MALTNYWSCCSFLLVAAFLAVYLLIGYLIAFGFELLWLLEPTTSLHMPAMLLCAGYFCIALFCSFLLHGLATKNNICLVGWMFAITLLTLPEAGLVIYLSIQYWRIESLYGITELACWLTRIIANLIELVLVHSLNGAWKEQEMVTKRLQDLSLTAITIPREHGLVNSQFHPSIGYDNDAGDHLNPGDVNRSTNSSMWPGLVLNNTAVPNTSTVSDNFHPYPLSMDGYHFVYMEQSEFNASVFLPHTQVDAGMKKSQSLMDLRTVHMINNADENKDMSQETEIDGQPPKNKAFPNYSLSLDRRCNFGKIPRFASMEALNDQTDTTTNTSIIKNRSGLFARPLADYGVPIYYGPLDGPDFLIYKKQIDKLTSKNSLSNISMDDVQKYRDVAL